MIAAKDNLIYLTRENQINKVLKDQKKYKSDIKILYLSEWDSVSMDLNMKLSNYEGPTMFVIDSFNMPHSFVIFKVTKTPTLVTLSSNNKIEVENYTSRIYKQLGL